ncbi:hypothetical protein [Candidatus Laterigemmans baculatus]|uniref:hypothetical protein n=1 Tax=Candidatus Laterigemmans baculatus TaxID=2770505 RepID=UPI0013DB48D2|nr:hypothetical protein [Candidatus Laterigemmans baculatus]
MRVIRDLLDWIGENEVLVGSLVTGSFVVFIATLFLVPWAVVRLPTAYFARGREERIPMPTMHPFLRAIVLVVKNLAGGVLLLLGVSMLVLPGQGLLTILMGLLLIDFPGKYKVERYIVSRKPILQSINWLRKRADRPPLQLD